MVRGSDRFGFSLTSVGLMAGWLCLQRNHRFSLSAQHNSGSN